MLTNNLFKRLTHKLFAPDVLQRETYEAFKRLLEHDRRCHELLADFQDLFFKENPTEWTRVVTLFNQLSIAVGSITNELPHLSARDATDLSTYYKKFDSYIRVLLQPRVKPATPPYIMWLDAPEIDPQLAGNKAANLGRVSKNFNHLVPKGFVVTTNSWQALLEYNNLRKQIDTHLLTLDPANHKSLNHVSQSVISLIEAATIPPEVEQDLLKASQDLIDITDGSPQTHFAVRSSAASEDGPNSFAGQYKSILNVSPKDLRGSYLQVLASKYSPKAILYRVVAGISDTDASMAVLIIEMIKAETAGVIYTADPAGEEKGTIYIYSVAGTGEKLVDGKSRAHLRCFKKNNQKIKAQPDDLVSRKESEKLTVIAKDLEDFFGLPQDIEWAIKDGEPFILQSRPLKTTHKQNVTEFQIDNSKSPEFSIVENNSIEQGDHKEKPVLPLLYHGGITAAHGRGTGPAHFLTTEEDQTLLPAGAVLIVDNIPASLILLLSNCSGVIASSGSVASHFATVCREFGIPLIVEAAGIREKLINGEHITLDADSLNVYKGIDDSYPSVPGGSRPKKNLPYFRRLQPILDFIAPLTILDPEANSFTPEACRSFHDIIRFAHEKGVRAMFGIGKSGSRRDHRKKLVTSLPFDLYLIDVDKSNHNAPERDDGSITFDRVVSAPFRALWHGLSHPSITWGDHVYYNWKEYDEAAMTDGFAFKNDTESASYAICGSDYLNLNIRFGYHFTIVDTLCGQNSEQNYCSIHFAGGGGTPEGRYYRLKYIEAILRKLDFQVTCKTDLLDGRLESLSMGQMSQSLVTIGRMLGTSKLMDMVLKDENSVASHLDLFFQCNDTLSIQDPPQ